MERAALKSGYELHNGASCYVIDSVLGKGGFGITYKAYSASVEDGHKSYFAVKEFFVEDWCERNEHTNHITSTNPARDKFENGKRDFFSEAKRLSQVSHSNIVKVYDVFEENNTVYYVMEYLEGESLDAYLKVNGALAETQALALMKPIFDAVEVLHANNMTHLDIKPANIMLKKTEDGNTVAVLIDFGLAKHYDTEGNPTTTLRQSGYSDGYSPIEQYSGISTFSPQSDVYALAATLFHCLTGHRPLKSTALTEQKLVNQFSADVSGNVKEAIIKAMRMNKKVRTQSVAMIIDELYMIESTQPISIVTEEPYISGESQSNYDYTNKYKEEKLSSRGNIFKIIYIIVVSSFIGWFCYDYMQDGAASSAKAMRQDSIANARQDSIRRDSIVKDSICQDSMWRYRVTPDLALFNLHGPVKSVKNQPMGIYGDLYNVNFSESGEVKSISSSGSKVSFSRGANGYISKVTSAYTLNNYTSYSFKYDGVGRPITTSYKNVDYDISNSFNATLSYDKDGHLIRESGRGGDVEGDYKRDNKNTILKVDEFGNWTKRKVLAGLLGYDMMYYTDVRTETRTITYYEKK